MIRALLLLPLIGLATLFVLGWWQTRADRGPRIEGKSLAEWDKALRSDGSLIDSANSPGHVRAIEVLQRNADVVITEAQRRAGQRARCGKWRSGPGDERSAARSGLP